MDSQKIQLFEDQAIRTAWDKEKEEWYFSIVDIIRILTEQPTQRGASNYWAKLKQRLKSEGAVQLLTFCQQLKMKSPEDGKRYITDVANTEQILRIIQSIPSPKAEPLKLWLAQVGRERLEEISDPEKTIDRALDTYLKKGYSEDWIHQRLLSIRVRNELTAEWQLRGVKRGREFAILTDEITNAWSGMTTRQYKDFKGLKKENLRDNMSTTEIILNMLAETATKDISAWRKPETFNENRDAAKRGGNIAGNARKELEKESGGTVITSQNSVMLTGSSPISNSSGKSDNDIRFEVLMYDKTANVIDILMKKYGWTENVAIERFTKSEIYSHLECQETGLWKLSDADIAEKFFAEIDN